MTVIREVVPTDKDGLKAFFQSLSDETAFRNSYFDSRTAKANTALGAQMAADVLTSEVVKDPIEQRVWLAEEIEIQGLGWLDFSWRPTMKHTCVLGIVVADQYQRRGIGTELMLRMIQEAKQLGMRKIWLRTYAYNQEAISLYRKFNFEIEGYFDKQEWKDDGTPLGVISMALFLK